MPPQAPQLPGATGLRGGEAKHTIKSASISSPLRQQKKREVAREPDAVDPGEAELGEHGEVRREAVAARLVAAVPFSGSRLVK